MSVFGVIQVRMRENAEQNKSECGNCSLNFSESRGEVFTLSLRLHDDGALGNLVSFVQFKKSGKHSWRSVTFSVNPPPWVFFRFFKLCKSY